MLVRSSRLQALSNAWHLEVRHLAVLVAEGVEVHPQILRLLPTEAVLVARLHEQVVDCVEVEALLLDSTYSMRAIYVRM